MNHSKRSDKPSSGSRDSRRTRAAQDGDELLSTSEGQAAIVRKMDAAIDKLLAKHRPAAPALESLGHALADGTSKTHPRQEIERFRVDGDSFLAFAVAHGHELSVDPLGAIEHGKLVVVSALGAPLTLRRIVENGSGIHLESPDRSLVDYRGAADNRYALHGVVIKMRPGM